MAVFDASVADPEIIHLATSKARSPTRPDRMKGHSAKHTPVCLFTDEIVELLPDLQPRLLRVLETREVASIGPDKAS